MNDIADPIPSTDEPRRQRCAEDGRTGAPIVVLPRSHGYTIGLFRLVPSPGYVHSGVRIMLTRPKGTPIVIDLHGSEIGPFARALASESVQWMFACRERSRAAREAA